MQDALAGTPVRHAAAPAAPTELRPSTRATLALALVAAVLVAGLPNLSAPWMLGDEYVFVVDNPDVNPAAAPGRPATLGPRLLALATKVHEDLYQPVPMLAYALEWAVSGGSPAVDRFTHVALHALNALLLWCVLRVLLARFTPAPAARVSIVAWALAGIWALHPLQVPTYAADMGRTHLLSATFALLALRLYIAALERHQYGPFVGALVMLVLAMLSKPIPGWVVLAFGLEALWNGWRRALRSPRGYIVGAVCVAFAALTMWTSLRSGIAEEASEGLFGDPLSRSALAAGIYLRSLLAPFWLAYWYLPDPRTGWLHPLVWLGLGFAALSGTHAVWCWHRQRSQLCALGWLWFWSLLLPVIGLIGAREAAAVDRYLYQPAMGLALILGVLILRAVSAGGRSPWSRAFAVAGAGVALAMVAQDRAHTATSRSVIRRAERVVQLNPDDPRAREGLAAALDFAQNHPMLKSDFDAAPELQAQHFHGRWHDELLAIARNPDLAEYFPKPTDRGRFYRRLAYRFLRAGDPELSLEQALEAQRLTPNEFGTWKRLAHAYQALGRFDEAASAYARCGALLPPDPATRAAHHTDFATLLRRDLGRESEACAEFAAALATGLAPPTAQIGGALCEIRYGDGATGFQLISAVLEHDPGNVDAGLVLAEYHLRSHHWDAAAKVYAAILTDRPTLYPALRGYHEVCVQTGQYRAAAVAWDSALEHTPDNRAIKSYAVWALAVANDPSASGAADEILAHEPDNPFACLARALLALRSGGLSDAVEWTRRAVKGAPIPEARALMRGAMTLRLLADRGELPADAVMLEGVLATSGELPPSLRDEVRGRLLSFANAPNVATDSRRLAARIAAELSPKSGTADTP